MNVPCTHEENRNIHQNIRSTMSQRGFNNYHYIYNYIYNEIYIERELSDRVIDDDIF